MTSCLSEFAQRKPHYGSLKELAPAEIVPTGNVLPRLANSHFGDSVHHPLEVVLTDPRRFAVRGRIAKVDRNRHAIAHGEFHGVKVVTEKLVQLQNALLDFLQNFLR